MRHSSANFSPDSKQIISTSGDNNLKLWDLAGNCLQTFVGHTYPSGLKFALETKAVCSTKVCRQLPVKSQSLRLLSTEAETICLPSGLKFTLTTPAVCPIKVCRQLPAKGNCLQTFVGHTNIGIVFSANFSPDGKQIISTSGDNNLKLWDLAGLQPQPYAQ
jgi:WD40 repeat protein